LGSNIEVSVPSSLTTLPGRCADGHGLDGRAAQSACRSAQVVYVANLRRATAVHGDCTLSADFPVAVFVLLSHELGMAWLGSAHPPVERRYQPAAAPCLFRCLVQRSRLWVAGTPVGAAGERAHVFLLAWVGLAHLRP